MFILDKEYYVIVNEKGTVEYDYDGPMAECVEGSDGKYIKDCLTYLSSLTQTPHRIVKVKLVEII